MFRTRAGLKKYKKSSKNILECPFCATRLAERVIVKKGRKVMVTKNDFSYSLWEGRKVIDHLMIVPLKHKSTYADLDDAEKNEILELISWYEDKGYDIYTRGSGSIAKTVPEHQHTHLIKTSGKQASIILYIKKPYSLVKF